MSFNFILDFQAKIYNMLCNSKEIKSLTSKIYLGLAKEAKYPFVSFQFLEIENNSKNDFPIYKIDFEINVFARDNNQLILAQITEKILNLITIKNFALDLYLLAGLKMQKIKFNYSQDMISTKLSINYNATIKKR